MDADAPGQRWAWTIVGPDDVDELEPEELWCFDWPHDLDVVEVWEMPFPPRAAQQFILELAVRRDEDDPGEPTASDGMIVRSGWTSDAISAALKSWSTVHAGRGDLHFFWDDIMEAPALVAAVEASDSPLLRHLHEAIDREREPKAILHRILDQL